MKRLPLKMTQLHNLPLVCFILKVMVHLKTILKPTHGPKKPRNKAYRWHKISSVYFT